MSKWITFKRWLTFLLWGYSDWFRLCDRLDEIRKDIRSGTYNAGTFVWNCEQWEGHKYRVTLEEEGGEE